MVRVEVRQRMFDAQRAVTNTGLVAGLGVFALLLSPYLAADVLRDGTIGPDDSIQPAGPDFVIDASMGEFAPGGQANLFHSFAQFDLTAAQSATFAGPGSVDNILARVTGGASDIDGLIASSIDGANLFLLNPQGVIFGPNARLNLSGSFHVSTADGIQLADGSEFAAAPSASTVLSIAPPRSFFFLGSSPIAPIDINGALLEVGVGETVSLVGGAINVDAMDHADGVGRAESDTVYAPGGVINVVAAASAGAVSLDDAGVASVNGFSEFADMRFSAAASEGPLEEGSNTVLDVAGDPGGRIVIRGGTLTMTDGALLSAATLGDTDHPGVGVDIELSGDLLMLEHAEIGVSTFGLGNAGDVQIVAAGRVEMRGNGASPAFNGFGTNANIGSRSFGDDFSGTSPGGDSGTVRITADEFVMRDRAFIQSTTFTVGNGGFIEINARRVDILSADRVATFISSSSAGLGDAGRVSMNAQDIIIQSAPGSFFTGIAAQGRSDSVGNPDGGGIELTATNRLELLDGAQISGSIFQGAGSGASIDIVAGDVLIRGSQRASDGVVMTDPFFPSGIFSSVFSGSTQAGGEAGTVNITADSLTLADGGTIRNAASFPTLGDSGDINITVNALSLSNSGNVANDNFGFGLGGQILVDAGTTTITGPTVAPTFTGTGLFARTGTAAAGASSVVLVGDSLILRDGGEIATTTFGQVQGGTVDISVETLLLSGVDSVPDETFPSGTSGIGARIISDSTVFQDFVAFSGGDGGIINVDAADLVVENGASITAQTDTPGRGGDINIMAGNATVADGGSINVSASGVGDAGTLQVAARRLDVTRGSIFAQADQSDGGEIELSAPEIRLRDGVVSATVRGGLGNGGNVTVNARDFLLLQASDIVADAVGGAGGNIRINTGAIVADSASTLSASSTLGVDGNVDINAPENDIEAAVAVPETNYGDAAGLLSERCSLQTVSGSSLTVAQGDGLPANPTGYLTPRIADDVPADALAEVQLVPRDCDKLRLSER